MLRKSFNYFSSKKKKKKIPRAVRWIREKVEQKIYIYLLKAAHKILDTEGFFPDEYNELREAQLGD